MGAEVCSDGKVRVEGGGAQLILQEGEIGSLPADDGEERVADRIAPWAEALGVWGARSVVVFSKDVG